MTKGDMATCLELCRQVVERRAAYKKLQARVAYLDKKRVSLEGEDAIRTLEEDRTCTTVKMDEVQTKLGELANLIKSEATPIHHIAVTECVMHKDDAQKALDGQKLVLEKAARMAATLARDIEKAMKMGSSASSSIALGGASIVDDFRTTILATELTRRNAFQLS